MEVKRYYKKLDIIRIIACIAVFLYHLNILKGGFLAVCIFFVLTGYLSFVTSFNKEKFSIKNYYVSKLKNIYLPFILVVFISIFIITLIPSINWVNLKPESTSAIFGYNNFWQINASLDYFARHVDSPFMHFWYISILLQFELIFPLLFIGLKKLNEKINNLLPLILLIIITIFCIFYFLYSSFYQNIMFVYYNTFTRVFSIFIGLTIGYINCYYRKTFIKKIVNSNFKNIIFYFYLLVLILMFLFIDSNSMFGLYMILTSLISCRLIEYGTSLHNDISIFDNITKFISSISYEIYLIQYPVIFLFQELEASNKYSYLLIIIITLIISCILHFSLNFRKNNEGKIKHFIFKIIVLSILVLISVFGFCKYMIAEDHTKELKELERQLVQNQELMQQLQEEYALKAEEEVNNWNLTLENLNNEESNLRQLVNNLHIVGIGDSVMLGAIKNLYQVFPKGYFDAKTSRTDWEANGILQGLNKKGSLGEPIIFGLGTNGQCGSSCRNKILKTIGNRKSFWITTTNRKTAYINSQLKELAKTHDNVYVIDWEKESNGHGEYFISDKIHLSNEGKKYYTNFIYNEIYNAYLNDLNKKREDLINKHNEAENLKITFFGNDLLLNSFSYIKEEFINAKFEIDNYTYDTLYLKIRNGIDKKELTHNLVFIFDNSFRISNDEYKKLIDLCSNYEVYILFINSKNNLNYKDVNVIDFDKEIRLNNEYLSIDKIHLTSEGNKALLNKLEEVFN